MSTLTPPKSGTAKASEASLRGSVHVILRTHRGSLWAAGALLVLGIGTIAALLAWVAVQRCPDEDVDACGNDDLYALTTAQNAAESLLSGGGSALLLLACLVGAFVTGPLIARELESGTFRMAWTQSVSPARWLAARLAVPAALSVAGVGLLSLVYRWGWTEVSHPLAFGLGWFNNGIFPGIGPVAVGYALFGVAVGALCALLVRRMLLSIVVTTAVLGVVMTGFTQRRRMLWPVDRILGNGHPGANAWTTETGMLTASGEKLFGRDCPSMDADHDIVGCMKARGGVTDFTDYHPASHFWPLQLVETGILLALAALAVFAAFRVLRRLHG
ncbi:ABC transporter permease [Streptomyces cyaneofuscatus]|uniref:ABC transporter permease n=1 Tax=Streptomyces cyaneofuscatus TaxID=66883 RepID=UPI00386D8FD7|nr:ABC transporter permease [Streptomyces cyaneofuscatus]